MHLQFKNFASLLLLIGGISVTPALFAQTTDLTLDLVDARLEILRNNAAASMDEIIQAYEIAHTRLGLSSHFRSRMCILIPNSRSVLLSIHRQLTDVRPRRASFLMPSFFCLV